MRRPTRLIPSLAIWSVPVVALAGCAGLAFLSAPASGADEKQVDFAKDVQPIFKASCVKCHSVDPNKPNKKAAAGLRLDDKAGALKGGKTGPAIVPGKSGESLVYTLLLGPVKHGDDEIDPMPKARKGEEFKPLPKEQIETIKAWIEQGAKWPD